MSIENIVISPVYVSEPGLLTTAQKYRDGFVCNVHADNLDLMRQAAKELAVEIDAREPRNPRGNETYVGIYTDATITDPKGLLQEFFKLLVARSQARAAHAATTKGATHAKAKSRKSARRKSKQNRAAR